jgi:hypothetical protein
MRLLSLCNILSDERMGLSFTIDACPGQRSHSEVKSPAGFIIIFLLSQIRDSPNLEGKVPRIYILQESSDPVIPPGTKFQFHRRHAEF